MPLRNQHRAEIATGRQVQQPASTCRRATHRSAARHLDPALEGAGRHRWLPRHREPPSPRDLADVIPRRAAVDVAAGAAPDGKGGGVDGT
jgi:hypothetical protein